MDEIQNDEFTDVELNRINENYSKNKFDHRITSFFGLLFLCIIGPLVPRKRSRTSMVEQMSYSDAFLNLLLGATIFYIVYLIYSKIKKRKEFEEISSSLTREFLEAEVVGVRKNIYKSYSSILKLSIEDEIIEYEFSDDSDIVLENGDIVDIEFEKITKTVLKIIK